VTDSEQDRLFPIDPASRAIARELYEATRSLPIISPHGHVEASLLLENQAFGDPAALLVAPDHYVTRLLTASGLDVVSLRADPRALWAAFVDHRHMYAGTATGYWLEAQLRDLFAVDLDSATPAASFDRISQLLREPRFRPRALFTRFNIEVLATTDDPLADLLHHRLLTEDAGFDARVLPTFRPDAYIDPSNPQFIERAAALSDWAGASRDDLSAYLEALEARRAHFVSAGAVSADHGVVEPFTVELDDSEAAALFRDAVRGAIDPAGARLLQGHFLMKMAEMSVRDGLVMTVHAGVHRNHSAEMYRRAGPDTGHDIPVATTFTENLRPLLSRFGLVKDFHLVLFTVDESTASRELAPLAGFYPSVYVGAPWWFLDAPDASQRFRAAVTETAGFYRGSGFIDDTRAFTSIPARHDMSRRLDAGFLARLVGEGRLSLGMAHRVAEDLVVAVPRKAFKL
jgi:glucuronate isomerase